MSFVFSVSLATSSHTLKFLSTRLMSSVWTESFVQKTPELGMKLAQVRGRSGLGDPWYAHAVILRISETSITLVHEPVEDHLFS